MYSIIASAISIIVFAFPFPAFGRSTERGSAEIAFSTISTASWRLLEGYSSWIIFTLLWVEVVVRTSRVNLVEGFINQIISSTGFQTNEN